MIGDAIRQAQAIHRRAVEATYDGECAIYEKQPEKDPITKVTSHKEVMVGENVSCHLSFTGSRTSAAAETVTTVPQTIKLFLASELLIKPGSKITVTQQGRTESYSQSGKAAVYSSHQEISLELFGGYA